MLLVRPMRALLILAFLLVGSRVGWAQVQERKLADRIMKPDYTQSYDVRKSSFGTDRTVGSKKASVKDFQYDQRFNAKTFESKSFWGSRPSWLGGKKFATAEASTKGMYEIPNAQKPYSTKESPVKEAREASKTMETKPSMYANRGFIGKGRSQDRFDLEKGVPKGNESIGYNGDLKTMTIDDIRTLLNKNK